MDNQTKRTDFDKIMDNRGKKSGYGVFNLTDNGVRGSMGKKNVSSASYLACWELNKERHFLGCTPNAVSFDSECKNEVKKVSVLVRNTEKAQRAYLASIIDTDAPRNPVKSPEFADMYHCLNDHADEFSFFLLITFSEDEFLTGFHFYSNLGLPLPIYTYSLKGNPPMSEMKDFFTLLFAVLTQGMERQEEYMKFLNAMMEDE